MDAVRPPAPAVRRTGSLLALALLATTVLSTLTPAAATSSVPLVEVVVTSTGAGAAATADAVRRAGGTVRDALPLVGGVSADLPAGAVLAPAFRVVANRPVTVAGKPGGPSDRDATGIRDALGLGDPAGQGAGVTIAVVDTGVTPSDAFAGRLQHLDVSGSWQEGEPRDPYGHGTFVAGIAAASGPFAGVAPGASVLDVRVADERGDTDLMTVLVGLQAISDINAAAESEDEDVDVVNLSLSSGSPLPYQIDPLTVALTELWASGVVVVVPSGNDGDAPASITSPGTDPTLLTVGALDDRGTSAEPDDDVVAAFSGRGPAPQGVAKPDLVAPGQSLVSLRAEGSKVDRKNRKARVGDDGTADPDGAYFRGSGTSFSTAAASGAAAVLLASAPATPDSIKAHLRKHAHGSDALGGPAAAGAGALDLSAALLADVETVAPTDLDLPPAVAEDIARWHAFLTALLDKDRRAAVTAWDSLSETTRTWAASRWAGLDPEASRWAANSWSASRWADAEVDADAWTMRQWAASRWAASRWASDVVASRWAANSWSASRWAGPEAAASRWAASRWAASRWAASRWAASRWAAASWG